ncbi:aminotransferase class IV [Desulfonatronum sp. SC1]|uniref:aminotransferase class IV n=1 Tax=Desulfonatronum sp. SC1 TaxID=2109626 RepID=UPI000D3144F4|nr:aminotransferase class IV [Desulfonatronum sp. SC1]PTN37748.1 4-amino-4-deoxychorismate lyase [Desulfonatronum sp. SC1]
MLTIVNDSDAYLERLLQAPRPGIGEVMAFYDHRVGAIGTDPRLMLLPLDDHMVHRGDGVFETMKFVERKLYQLDPHVDRLMFSARSIFLEPPCPWEDMKTMIVDVARAANTDQGMVRILLGRGPGGFGIDPRECPKAGLYIVAYALHPRPESAYEKGVTASRCSMPAKRGLMAKIKSVNYLPNVLMKREAVQAGCDYSLCFDDDGFLAEGAVENVCLVDAQGRLVVPELNNALTGTTLMRALDAIKDEMSVVFRQVTEDDVYLAREVILLGTTIDALSVVRFNKKPIHDVRPGPVSKKMRQFLIQDLQENGIVL